MAAASESDASASRALEEQQDGAVSSQAGIDTSLPPLSAEEQSCMAQLKASKEHGYRLDRSLARFAIASKADYTKSEARLARYKELETLVHPQSIRARHVRQTLERGAIALPGTCDKLGGTLIVYHADRHVKAVSDYDRIAALKALLYVVELAHRSNTTVTNGISIIANLGGLSFNKLDHSLHKMVLTTLQDAYPARVRRLYLVYPSTMTSMLVKVMRPFMKAKLQARMVLVPTFERLSEHVEAPSLPAVFGGSLAFDHKAWLKARLEEEDVPIEELSAKDELDARREIWQANKKTVRKRSTSVTSSASVASASTPASTPVPATQETLEVEVEVHEKA